MILLCVSSSYTEDHEKSKSAKPIANDDESVKGGEDEPPEGYYAFVESPNAEPPKVRPPPYIDSDKECYGRSGRCKEHRTSKRDVYEMILKYFCYFRKYRNIFNTRGEKRVTLFISLR